MVLPDCHHVRVHACMHPCLPAFSLMASQHAVWSGRAHHHQRALPTAQVQERMVGTGRRPRRLGLCLPLAPHGTEFLPLSFSATFCVSFSFPLSPLLYVYCCYCAILLSCFLRLAFFLLTCPFQGTCPSPCGHPRVAVLLHTEQHTLPKHALTQAAAASSWRRPMHGHVPRHGDPIRVLRSLAA